jgi:hypothetical protein
MLPGLGAIEDGMNGASGEVVNLAPFLVMEVFRSGIEQPSPSTHPLSPLSFSSSHEYLAPEGGQHLWAEC